MELNDAFELSSSPSVLGVAVDLTMVLRSSEGGRLGKRQRELVGAWRTATRMIK